MKNRITFGITATAALAFSLALQRPALAQHDHGSMSMPSPSAPAARKGNVTGTLVSRDETSIKVEAKKTGAATYMIDSKTKFKGDVQPGGEVTVQYEDQGGMRMATTVEAKKAPAKHNH